LRILSRRLLLASSFRALFFNEATNPFQALFR